MKKAINLDQFATGRQVSIGGVTYSVRGMLVKEFIDDSIAARMQAVADDSRKSAVAMVDILTELSDIPREVLENQPFAVLDALIRVSQGVDPTAQPVE